MTPEQKIEFDNMSYYQMLTLYRFAPIGDIRFQDESGEYFIKEMGRKKDLLTHDETVATSKAVGWENG